MCAELLKSRTDSVFIIVFSSHFPHSELLINSFRACENSKIPEVKKQNVVTDGIEELKTPIKWMKKFLISI